MIIAAQYFRFHSLNDNDEKEISGATYIVNCLPLLPPNRLLPLRLATVLRFLR